MSRQLTNYNHTIYASYVGYVCQAVINNFAPLLFLTFQSEFHLTLQNVTFITTVNFLVQLVVDLLSAKFVDSIGYRRCLVAAHIFAALDWRDWLFCRGFFPHIPEFCCP